MSLDLSIRIGGPAGSGIQTIGYALAKAFLRGGQHVFAAQDYMSRIRGGHNYFEVRASDKPIYASSAKIDILRPLIKSPMPQSSQFAELLNEFR